MLVLSQSSCYAEFMTDSILESISDGVFTVDAEWRVTSFNKAAEKITGMRRVDAIGKLCHEVFRSNMCELECPLRRTMKTGKPIIDKKGYCISAEGERIPISVSTALLMDSQGQVAGGAETFRDLRELEDLKEKLHTKLQTRSGLETISSRSPAMLKILDLLPVIAESPSSVLLDGETGTGKELTARAIHELSPRKEGPFIALNCGALPDTLLESELFGYKKGAFTGADKDKPGRFRLAENGTLFLDEIGDISPALQVKLLRVLQEKEYEALGSTVTEKAGARIICATNKDLKALVDKGTFRQDLFYRINVIKLSLPPLRHRKEDIPQLAEYFLQKYGKQMHKHPPVLSPEVYTAFYAYSWPGNIRELENVIERVVVLCTKNRVDIATLPPEFASLPAQANTIFNATDAELPGDMRALKKQAERSLIIDALQKHRYRCSVVAHELGIDKATLYRKIKAYGIDLNRE